MLPVVSTWPTWEHDEEEKDDHNAEQCRWGLRRALRQGNLNCISQNFLRLVYGVTFALS